jgi:hypothetical protein
MGRVKPVLLFLVLVPVFGMAQSAQDSWDNLKQLRPGQKIEVVDTSMKSLRGPFVSVSEEAITLEVGKTQESIERAKVVRVSVRDTSHRTRNMLIGAAVGVGAGLALTVPLEVQQGNEGNTLAGTMAGVTAALGGAGLGIGAIPGSRTVYRIKK